MRQPGALLVVDDNPSSLKLVSYLAKRSGWTVEEASCATEALASVACRPPRLALLDLHLPETNGLELAQRLRANPETSRIPIVLMTASTAPVCADEAAAAGIACVVRKPIDTRALPQLLQAFDVGNVVASVTSS